MAVSVAQGSLATLLTIGVGGLVTLSTLYFNSQEKIATINAAARSKASKCEDLYEDYILCERREAVCDARCPR